MTLLYRALLEQIAEATEAEAVVLVIVGGTHGSGVAIKIDAPTTAAAYGKVPELVETLHETANNLAADAQARQRATGN